MQDQPLNCQLRVLVIDTHLMRRVSLANTLRQNFADVFVMEGDAASLLDRAAQQIIQHRCHVAVVVHDPDTPRSNLAADLKGLKDKLAPAGIVVCALRPDDVLAFRAGRMRMEYVRYDDPTSELWAAVASVGRQDCHCALQVEWPHSNFAEYVTRKLRWPEGSVTAADLYDLMGRVFPGASHVHLQLLPELQTTSLIASAIGRAVVLTASERYPGSAARRIPKVLKIGPAAEIAREIDRYEHYVDGWLYQYRQARLENHARIWHLGAIAYAFLGATPHDMAPFRAYFLYPRSQSETILNIFRQLFTETCQSWYTQERSRVPEMVLFDEYDKALDLRQRIEERLDIERAELHFTGIPDPLPNPALWALETGRQKQFASITTSITHGDLHADNLFVDRNLQAWLIDFGRSGFGHALRDFVELEADIKLRLITRGGADLASLAALERSLLTQEAVNSLLIPATAVGANPALHKPFQVIVGLRHLAYLTTAVTDPVEYFHALLYETLFMATLRRLQNPIRERAWFSAALLAEHLQRLEHDALAPAALPGINNEALAQQSPAVALKSLHAQLRYLVFCEDSARLQISLYAEDAVPAPLQEGLARLGQEIARGRRLLDSLRAQQQGEQPAS